VWREMQMQACAMRMLLAVYTNVRRRHANRSGVAQNIPLSAVVEIDRKPAKKKTERSLTVGAPHASVQIPTGTTSDFDRSIEQCEEQRRMLDDWLDKWEAN